MIPTESLISSIRAIAGVCVCRNVLSHLTIHLVENFRPTFLIYLGHSRHVISVAPRRDIPPAIHESGGPDDCSIVEGVRNWVVLVTVRPSLLVSVFTKPPGI